MTFHTASAEIGRFRTAPYRGIGEASADGTAASPALFCLAYRQDSAPSFHLSTSSAEKLEAFWACAFSDYDLALICCHWIGQPQVNPWSRGELDFTRRLEEGYS